MTLNRVQKGMVSFLQVAMLLRWENLPWIINERTVAHYSLTNTLWGLQRSTDTKCTCSIKIQNKHVPHTCPACWSLFGTSVFSQYSQFLATTLQTFCPTLTGQCDEETRPEARAQASSWLIQSTLLQWCVHGTIWSTLYKHPQTIINVFPIKYSSPQW